MIDLNKIGLNQVQLNQLYLNTLCACQKSSGGDGFPRLPGDVTRWSFKGLTNEQMSKNPRLEDADHKGRFLTFKNFAWGGMSGVDGYKFNFLANEWVINNNQVSKKYSYKIVINNKQNSVQLYNRINLGHIKITLKITGIEINKSVFRVYDNAGTEHVQDYTKDGIYEIDYTSNEGANIIYFYVFGGNMGQLENPITIEQLPLYPGFIIGDGVDDYAVTEKNLDFEDTYTVYTAFIPFQEDPARNMVLFGKNYLRDIDFRFTSYVTFYSANSYAVRTLSNGFNIFVCKRTGNKLFLKNMITGNSMEADAKVLIDNPGLYYLWRSETASYAKAAIAGQVICNGHFTTDEEDTKVLNWYKKEYPWLFFDQAWTVVGKSNEDTDRATIANITGNGNNLVLSNFGFAGNSGYGEYAYNWNTWKINKVDSTKSNVYHNRMEITLPAIGESSCTQCNFYSPLCEVGTIYDFSFKISGLTDNSTVFVKPGTNGGGAIIAQYNKDGVYHLNYTLTDEAIVNESTQNRIYFFIQNFSDEEMNLTIEQIPEYEGYLVTDGVDDEVKSSSFSMAKDFTVVGEWELLDKDNRQSGLAKPTSFYLYSRGNKLAFYCKDRSKPELLNLKSIVAFNSKGVAYDNKWQEYTNNVVGNDPTYDSIFYLGYGNNNYSKVAFKNLATYVGRILSKDDCIKAYNYLQTLKAK